MSEFSRSLAVVIGIDDYRNGINSLQTATNDAQEIARILKQEHKYEQVWLLLDDQATRTALEQLLDQILVEKIQADDRLFFYFAGHGIALNGDEGPEGYLVPQDAKLGVTDSYFPMSQLQESLSKLPCRHFLGILDCCFAGAFRWSSTRDVGLESDKVLHQERYDRFIQDPAWQAITSASYDQKALDSLAVNSERGQKGQHSPFAAALIEALAGKADLYPPAEPGKPGGDGVITATELYLYLRDRVEPPTEELRHRQTPGIWPLKKHDKGEYIFLAPGHVLNLPPAPPLDESRNPYRGLQSFEAEQSDLFFGRSALTAKLSEFVSQQPLTVVLGASGSGKSSLVKAGLIPYLKQQVAKADHPQNYSQWQLLAPMRPGESPFKALSNTFAQATVFGVSIPEAGSASKVEMLTQYMADWCQQHLGMKLLLTIDQFEELITLCRDEKEREQFLSGLAQAVTAYPQQLRLVLTLRSDFEPQFQDGLLKDLWSAARFVVPAMTRSELRETIEEPASKRVMYFQSDDPKNPLIDQLINEVAEMPGALPLLSFTLSELYLKYLRRQKVAHDRGDSLDRAITEADYKELGGVARSLTQRADQEYEALVQQDKAYEQTIRHVMLRMVAVGGGELARRKVPLSEFEYPPTQNDRVAQVIERFSAARLVVKGQDLDGKPYAEPAHDALVRGWQKLLTWKQEEEESLILQRRLTPAAEEWKEVTVKKQSKGLLAKAKPVINGLDRGFYTIESLLSKASAQVVRLWQRSQPQQERSREQSGQFLWNTNPYLDVLNEQLQSKNNWFNQIEAEFVQESVLQRRQNTSWRWRIATAVILGLSGLTIAALIGQRNAQIGQAQASRQNAEANLLSKQELDALISALRAGKALETLPPFGLFKPSKDLTQVGATLQKAIDQTTERNRFEIKKIIKSSQDRDLADLGFSEKGKLVATIITKSTIELWDLKSGEKLRQFDAINLGSGQVFQPNAHPVFSPNGHMLAIRVDEKIQLWDIQSKQQLPLPKQPPVNISSNVFFSPDSKTLAVIGENSEIGLWDLESRIWKIHSPMPKNFIITDVIWSNDKNELMLSNHDDGVYAWSLNDNRIEKKNSFKDEDTSYRLLTFSPSNKLAATMAETANYPNPYHLWRLDNDSEPKLITSFIGYKPLHGKGVIWSHDGQKAATVDSDWVVRLWPFENEGGDFPNDKTAGLIENHNNKGGFLDPSWNPKNRDSLDRIKEKLVEKFPEGERNQIEPLINSSNVGFSPDGKKLAIFNTAPHQSGVVDSIWDLESQMELNILSDEIHNGNRNEVDSFSFSPDNKLLAISVGSDLFLWDLMNNQGLPISIQGDESCNHVEQDFGPMTFSPDGKLLAFIGRDRSICLLSVSGSQDLSGLQVLKFKPRNNITNLIFAPDGKALYGFSENKIDKTTNKIVERWSFESLDELIKHGCSLVHDYLNDPGSAATESDRHLCDGVGEWKPIESASVTSPTFLSQSSPPPQNRQPLTQAAPSSPLAPPASNRNPSAPSATPSPFPQSTPLSSPQRYKRGEIQFPPGATSTKVSGELKPRDTDIYTFTASAGQVLTIYAITGRVSLKLTPQGKFVSPSSVVLPTSGTYTVRVVNKQTSSVVYTFSLEIKSRS